MAKSTDVPTELREFNKVFNELGAYRWDCGDVFDDFLDFMIACLSPTGDKELAEMLKKKYGKEYGVFSRMMGAMMEAYRSGTYRNNWFDGLGLYYECIASGSKASRLGQFFTPPTLCDMMAIMSSGTDADDYEEPTEWKTVNDPCSGSGRLLLAFNAQSPKNYFYGGDIDRICAKMTAVNMCLHAMHGQAICGNSLWLDEDWYFGFQINRLLKYGIPSIEKISKEQCFQAKAFVHHLEIIKAENAVRKEEMAKEELQQKIADKIAKTVERTGQMSLF